MAKGEYRVGAISVKSAAPPLSVKAGAHRPRMQVTVRRIPEHHGQHVPLTCVPTAFWNAAAMAGQPVALDAIGQAKRYTSMGCLTEMPVFMEHLGWAAPEIAVKPIWVKARGDRTRYTLHEAVARLQAEGYTTGVVSTRTPNHAFAMHLCGDGSVQIVDNGGFPGIAGWRGNNIRQLYGVRACPRPGEDTMPPTSDARRAGDMAESQALDAIEGEVQRIYDEKMAAIALSRRALAAGRKVHYPVPDPSGEGRGKTACGLPVADSYVAAHVGLEWVNCNRCLAICG